MADPRFTPVSISVATLHPSSTGIGGGAGGGDRAAEGEAVRVRGAINLACGRWAG